MQAVFVSHVCIEQVCYVMVTFDLREIARKKSERNWSSWFSQCGSETVVICSLHEISLGHQIIYCKAGAASWSQRGDEWAQIKGKI